MSEIAKEIADILLDVRAITLSPSKPYRFVSGIFSPIYCDNRLLMSYPEKRKKIIDYFVEVIRERNLDFDVVAGIASSGIPHAAWIAERLGKPMIYIRKKTKEHGKENLIEGKLEKGQKVVIVEDLISTGSSSVNGVEAVRDQGGIVENCLVIFTYEMEKAKENFRNARCELIPLSDFTTLIEVASERNYIKPEERLKTLEWNKDPQNWGKNMGFE
ncbi:MAG: orotate phosphoribosyltransferase [Candidatus Aenigmarchaeota archaeon]|nr:orotate phosphoribosyltransferase [Candidatus Aenigmarchaeota archaeon]